MADRVSVSITIGGVLPHALLDAFEALVRYEALATDWDGETFDRTQVQEGGPLSLMAHEVASGQLDEIEAFCVTHTLPFARWSDGYPGQWGAERVVFPGVGEPVRYAADGDDTILMNRETAERLGSIEAIRSHFAAADFEVPVFRID